MAFGAGCRNRSLRLVWAFLGGFPSAHMYFEQLYCTNSEEKTGRPMAKKGRLLVRFFVESETISRDVMLAQEMLSKSPTILTQTAYCSARCNLDEFALVLMACPPPRAFVSLHLSSSIGGYVPLPEPLSSVVFVSFHSSEALVFLGVGGVRLPGPVSLFVPPPAQHGWLCPPLSPFTCLRTLVGVYTSLCLWLLFCPLICLPACLRCLSLCFRLSALAFCLAGLVTVFASFGGLPRLALSLFASSFAVVDGLLVIV